MFDTLAKLVHRDRDLPERTWRLETYRRVLHGSIYDPLGYEFHEEKTGSDERYVPLRDRKPSVRYNLCKLAVQDSLALLFGDGHFPAIDFQDEDANKAFAAVVKDSILPQVMADAALRGSIGSVAVLMRVLKGRVFFKVMDSWFLTPEWDPDVPDTLIRVTERYKVKGRALRDQGYRIDPDLLESDFWFQRVWDANAETWFLPEKVQHVEEQPKPVVDPSKTVTHQLGFVPMVWIRNLPGGDDIDGACTFSAAVDTQIELEYQLSQAGRGLKYSSDPLLMIREPAGVEGAFVRSGDNAMVVEKDGDAKLLEISGNAAAAVIEYVRSLREMALESIHGNRSNADKIAAAQSGRALELMHQPLIWLADQLRGTYGETGLLALVRMVCLASTKFELKTKLGVVIKLPTNVDAALRWPAWFQPTGSDRERDALALSTFAASGHVSRETAVKSIAPMFDVEDVPAELALIKADQAEADARAVAVGAQIQAKENLPT